MANYQQPYTDKAMKDQDKGLQLETVSLFLQKYMDKNGNPNEKGAEIFKTLKIDPSELVDKSLDDFKDELHSMQMTTGSFSKSKTQPHFFTNRESSTKQDQLIGDPQVALKIARAKLMYYNRRRLYKAQQIHQFVITKAARANAQSSREIAFCSKMSKMPPIKLFNRSESTAITQQKMEQETAKLLGLGHQYMQRGRAQQNMNASFQSQQLEPQKKTQTPDRFSPYNSELIPPEKQAEAQEKLNKQAALIASEDPDLYRRRMNQDAKLGHWVKVQQNIYQERARQQMERERRIQKYEAFIQKIVNDKKEEALDHEIEVKERQSKRDNNLNKKKKYNAMKDKAGLDEYARVCKERKAQMVAELDEQSKKIKYFTTHDKSKPSRSNNRSALSTYDSPPKEHKVTKGKATFTSHTPAISQSAICLTRAVKTPETRDNINHLQRKVLAQNRRHFSRRLNTRSEARSNDKVEFSRFSGFSNIHERKSTRKEHSQPVDYLTETFKGRYLEGFIESYEHLNSVNKKLQAASHKKEMLMKQKLDKLKKHNDEIAILRSDFNDPSKDQQKFEQNGIKMIQRSKDIQKKRQERDNQLMYNVEYKKDTRIQQEHAQNERHKNIKLQRAQHLRQIVNEYHQRIDQQTVIAAKRKVEDNLMKRAMSEQRRIDTSLSAMRIRQDSKENAARLMQKIDFEQKTMKQRQQYKNALNDYNRNYNIIRNQVQNNFRREFQETEKMDNKKRQKFIQKTDIQEKLGTELKSSDLLFITQPTTTQVILPSFEQPQPSKKGHTRSNSSQIRMQKKGRQNHTAYV